MVNREQRTEASARQLSWQSKMICRNLVEEICSGIIQKAVDLLKVMFQFLVVIFRFRLIVF
jgi:hypothetical protein